VAVRLAPVRGGVVLEVADAGPGMPPQDTARAFDRFHRGGDRAGGQADAGMNGSGSGSSGLGLSIVQAIAVAHGGQATLESRPGQGTRVRVWLPTVTQPGQVA
jgi:signal transduction histidine kinase